MQWPTHSKCLAVGRTLAARECRERRQDVKHPHDSVSLGAGGDSFTPGGFHRFVIWITGLALNVEEHTITAAQQVERRLARLQRQEEKARWAAAMMAQQALDHLSDLLVQATLLTEGFHKHGGSWRKKTLERLWAYRSLRKPPTLPYHLVVIEEAHNILHHSHDVERSEREAGRGKRLLDQVVRLLQEGRELGIGVVVVDQSPGSLAEPVLKNTNTKIIHRLEDGEEMKVVGRAIGLAEEEWSDLAELEDEECVVKTKQSPRPFKLAPFPGQELPEANGSPSFPPHVSPPYRQAQEGDGPAPALVPERSLQPRPPRPHEVRGLSCGPG